jgi:hypothetical protein
MPLTFLPSVFLLFLLFSMMTITMSVNNSLRLKFLSNHQIFPKSPVNKKKFLLISGFLLIQTEFLTFVLALNLFSVSFTCPIESIPIPSKHSSKTSSDAGITILINPLSDNACHPIRGNLDSDSNVSEVSDPHPSEQPSLKISTDAGIPISINSVTANVCFSIRNKFDPDSNVGEVSDLHRIKQH